MTRSHGQGPSATPRLRVSRGGAYKSRGKFFARVTVSAQKREAVVLPWCTSLADAKKRAEDIQALVNRLRAIGQDGLVPKLVESAATADAEKMDGLARVVDGVVAGAIVRADAMPLSDELTIRQFGESWTSGELHRRYPDHVPLKDSAKDDEERLRKHVYPIVGDVLLRAFTLAHAQEVMRQLDPKLSKGTRRQVAQLMNRVLRLAAYPAQLIPHSPLPPGFVPKPDKDKAKSILYPDEEAQLLACTVAPLSSTLR